jgi:alpha-ribazole phosphatase
MENRIIYLVRHGKIQRAGDERRYVGHIDLPLTQEGIKQAQNLQKRFERVKLGAIYCSDLSRSTQTAKTIVGSRKLPVIPRKDLREVSMGKWEGCTFGEIAQQFPDEFKARGNDIASYQVPGGESFAECSKRVVAALEDIMASTSGNLLIVGHAAVNRLLLCHILGMPIGNLFRILQDHGCLNVIQCGHASYQIKLINGSGRNSHR